jgi:hypothetical protein
MGCNAHFRAIDRGKSNQFLIDFNKVVDFSRILLFANILSENLFRI